MMGSIVDGRAVVRTVVVLVLSVLMAGCSASRAVGTDVFLIPRTPYADKRIAAIYGDGKQPQWGVHLPDADPLFEQYMRKTVASSGGSFSFDHVADGGYYVVAMIHAPSEVAFLQFPIVEQVDVEDGRSVRVVMRGY